MIRKGTKYCAFPQCCASLWPARLVTLINTSNLKFSHTWQSRALMEVLSNTIVNKMMTHVSLCYFIRRTGPWWPLIHNQEQNKVASASKNHQVQVQFASPLQLPIDFLTEKMQERKGKWEHTQNDIITSKRQNRSMKAIIDWSSK